MDKLKLAVSISAAILCGWLATALAQDDTQTGEAEPLEISYSAFSMAIGNNSVATARIPIYGGFAEGELRDGSKYLVVLPGDISSDIAQKLNTSGAEVIFMSYDARDAGAVAVEEDMPLWLSVAFNMLPFLIFLLFFYFIIRSMRKSSDGPGGYYARAEKMNREFLDRLEKLLLEKKNNA